MTFGSFSIVVFIQTLKQFTNKMNKFEKRIQKSEESKYMQKIAHRRIHISVNVIRFQIQKQTHTFYAKEKLHSTLWLIWSPVYAFCLQPRLVFIRSSVQCFPIFLFFHIVYRVWCILFIRFVFQHFIINFLQTMQLN